MKKKLLVSTLSAIMALSLLVGCGGSSTSESETEEAANTEVTEEAEEETAEAEEPAEKETISLILAARNEFQSTIEAGALEIAEEYGINLITQDPNNDTSKQLQYVETARNDGQKAVIIIPIDPETCPQLIEAAGDMKVIFMNTPPTDLSILNENVCYVGSDEMQSGYFQGAALAERFKAEGKTEAKYILLQGMLGQVATTNRSLSFVQGLEENGITAVEATAPLVADWDRATAQDMLTPLTTTIEYDCVVANNDAMALGAIEALKAANIDLSEVPVCGIDATADGCAAVANGEMFMTVFQDAVGQGKGAIQAAMNMLEGKAINEGIDFELDDENPYVEWVPFVPVDKDNVADYMS